MFGVQVNIAINNKSKAARESRAHGKINILRVWTYHEDRIHGWPSIIHSFLVYCCILLPQVKQVMCGLSTSHPSQVEPGGEGCIRIIQRGASCSRAHGIPGRLSIECCVMLKAAFKLGLGCSWQMFSNSRAFVSFQLCSLICFVYSSSGPR